MEYGADPTINAYANPHLQATAVDTESLGQLDSNPYTAGMGSGGEALALLQSAEAAATELDWWSFLSPYPQQTHIHLHDLAYEASDEEIMQLFAGCGTIIGFHLYGFLEKKQTARTIHASSNITSTTTTADAEVEAKATTLKAEEESNGNMVEEEEGAAAIMAAAAAAEGEQDKQRKRLEFLTQKLNGAAPRHRGEAVIMFGEAEAVPKALLLNATLLRDRPFSVSLTQVKTARKEKKLKKKELRKQISKTNPFTLDPLAAVVVTEAVASVAHHAPSASLVAAPSSTALAADSFVASAVTTGPFLPSSSSTSSSSTSVRVGGVSNPSVSEVQLWMESLKPSKKQTHVFVSKICSTASVEEVVKLFSPCGEMLRLYCPKASSPPVPLPADPSSATPSSSSSSASTRTGLKGNAIIQFSTSKAAEKALILTGTKLQGTASPLSLCCCGLLLFVFLVLRI